jgi:cation:H+ antiporter
LAATVKPLSAPGIGRFDLWVMIAFSVALLPMLWTGRRLQRLEGGLLLAGYVGYLWTLWPR